jgi:AcrR family transcriptional regulator
MWWGSTSDIIALTGQFCFGCGVGKFEEENGNNQVLMGVKEPNMTKIERRQLIMREAEKLFTSRRFHEVTLDEIAESAHVGKGTIYRYFKDKDDLFFQVATSGFDELCSVIQTRVPDGGSFIDRLKGACREIGSFFCNRRQLMRMMQGEASRMQSSRGEIKRQLDERRGHLLRLVAAIFEEGVAQGTVRNDIPSEVLAGFLLGMLRTRAREMARIPWHAKDYGVLVDLFFNGACTQNGSGVMSGRHTAATM